MAQDVIVVGAGPGGSSAAITLARAGLKVLLLDRSEFPREKTCGSGLSPNAIKVAEQLGVIDEIRKEAAPIRSMKLVTPGGRSMILTSNVDAVVLLRRDFDHILQRRALALGADFKGGVRAHELIREGGRVVGVRMADGKEHRAQYVLCADGAHSIFSTDPRPKRSISTLMGWWENADFVPGQIEMIFDKNVLPLYGWLFPETATRVNIGICIEGQDASGEKTERNVREVFDRFIDDHYAERLKKATQVGRLKGHPIVYTTWVSNCTAPGALYLGEAARVTHNATGEGISHAMQSGVYAAEAIASVLERRSSEAEAWRKYTWRHRKRFTAGFIGGHLLRAAVRTPLLDGLARAYHNPIIRGGAVRFLGSALAGASARETNPARPS